METPQSSSWRAWLQLLLGLGLSVLFFFMMAPFMVALLLGGVLAIICYPAFLYLAKKVPTWLSALSVTVAVAVGILLPLGFVALSGAYELLGMLTRWRVLRDGGIEGFAYSPWISGLLTAVGKLIPINREWLHAQALTSLHDIVEYVSRVTGSFLAQIPSLILAVMVVAISFYFFLVDGAKFMRFLGGLSPLPSERSLEIYETFQRSCRGVVLSLLGSAFVQGILILTMFLILGLPEAFLAGVMGMILGMVPVVGTAPLTLGTLIYLLAQGHYGSAVVAMVFVIVIGFSDNVVRPWILKGQAEMHPLLALVSTFGAVNLLGATGIFLGPIIAAVFVSFLKILAGEIRPSPIAKTLV